MLYILFHRNGGWFTASSQLHSDYKQAKTFDRDEAIDMCRLHSGKLMPVERDLYVEAVQP